MLFLSTISFFYISLKIKPAICDENITVGECNQLKAEDELLNEEDLRGNTSSA